MSDSEKKFRWPALMKILDRYVAQEYVFNYLIALLVVISLRVLIDVFIYFDEFLEETAAGETLGALDVIFKIIGYYGPKLFEYFRDFSGTIILLAAAFALTRMTRQNELTAVLASGVSLKRVIAPVVILGFLLNMLMVLDQELILPRLADKLSRYHDELEGPKSIPICLIPDREGALVCAQAYDPRTMTMTNIHIILRRDLQMVGLITAEQALWDGTEWILEKGRLYDQSSDNPTDAAVTHPVRSISRYPSDVTPEDILLQRNSDFKSLMSTGELTDLLRRGNMTAADQAEAKSEINFRITDPIINMIMLLLGLTMLVSREIRSTRSAMFLAFMGAGGCFVVTFTCKLLGGDVLVPYLAAWLPIIVFLPLSVLAVDGMKT
ncbi:MAG: LptF/LptG family permease [Sedimentisphaerales bacterium]|nr:LptF/LptG family permease [Sedimentisphaerales bacterium]